MTEHIDGTWTPLSRAIKQPPVWIIEDVLPAGIMFISGPPKTMKSTLLMALALAIRNVKCKTLPDSMKRMKMSGIVMGLSAEASAGELRYMVESGMGAKLPDDDGVLIADNPWEFRLDDDNALTRVLEWLDARRPRMFFLDPLRDFHSLDEKDDGGMNRLLRPIQRWAKDNDSSFVVVHHTKKKNTREEGDYKAGDMRGTGALFGIADGVIMITPRGKEVLHMEATFKRGSGWERDITLGLWGKEGMEHGVEDEEAMTLEPDGVRVLKAYMLGAKDQASIAKQLGKAKAFVVEQCKVLVNMGALVHDGRGYKVTQSAASIAKLRTR